MLNVKKQQQCRYIYVSAFAWVEYNYSLAYISSTTRNSGAAAWTRFNFQVPFLYDNNLIASLKQ